jgi:hypothetical protein
VLDRPDLAEIVSQIQQLEKTHLQQVIITNLTIVVFGHHLAQAGRRASDCSPERGGHDSTGLSAQALL